MIDDGRTIIAGRLLNRASRSVAGRRSDGIRRSLPAPLPLPDPATRLDAVAGPSTFDLRVLFEPVHWLADGSLAAVDAHVRRPDDVPLGGPTSAELDRRRVRHALTAALGRGVAGIVPVMARLGADSHRAAAVRELAAVRHGVAPRCGLVVGLTAADVARGPLAAMAAAGDARRLRLGVALDDVGADARALGFLALLRPDVVRLDVRALRHANAGARAEVVAAVRAYAESTGAVVVARHVDSAADDTWARAAGADAVQGARSGPERELVDLSCAASPIPLLREPAAEGPSTPFALVEHQGDVRRATRAELVAASRNLERWASSGDTGAVLVTVDAERALTAATAASFRRLAAHAPLTAIVGPGVPSRPAPGVAGTPLAGDDPLRDEWTVVVLGAHRAATLTARRVEGPDDDYDAVVTHRREIAVQAARLVLERVTGRPSPGTPNRSDL